MSNFKKYFLCLLISILAVSFIVNIYSFCTNIGSYVDSGRITKDPENSSLESIASDLEESLNTNVQDLQETYGESYPALGIMYYKTVLYYSSVTIVQNFLFSLIAGFALGNMIFFIFIAKCSKYKVVIALILTLVLSGVFFALSDILTYFVNNEDYTFGFMEIFWNTEAISIPYIIACVILYVVHVVSKTFIEIRNGEDV